MIKPNIKKKLKKPQVTLRQETAKDNAAVFKLIEEAFKNDVFSDQNEQFIVEALRKSKKFIPELSIVAAIEGKVVGHILLSEITIKNEQSTYQSLALAPVAVLPAFQKIGVGGRLIQFAHQKAKELGFKSVIVLGHESYYPKFGYLQADKYGITLPFNVPKENCMAIELVPNGLQGINGMVAYPKEFYL